MRAELTDPRLFVAAWFKSEGITIKANNVIEGPLYRCTIDSLWLDYLKTMNAEKAILKAQDTPYSGRGIGVREMGHAFKEYLATAPALARIKLIEGLYYTGEATAPLDNWILAVMGEVTPFYRAIMQHFLWQIKRKMYEKKVVYHLCPMLFGAQGGGKSNAVAKLLGPINDLSTNLPPTEVTDPRNAKTLNERLVCVFDEMSGMSRVDMEAFKRVITDESISYRPLGTNDSRKVKQNTTFIGISNKSLPENIYDSTGLRRFVEIVCADKLNWDLVNNTDAIAIWKSINENLEQGYILPHLEALKAHQESMVAVEEVPHFVTDNGLCFEPGEETKEMTLLEIHNRYMTWRESNGYGQKTPVIINYFSGKLRTAKLYSRKHTADGKQRTLFTINKNAFATKTIHMVATPAEFKND